MIDLHRHRMDGLEAETRLGTNAICAVLVGEFTLVNHGGGDLATRTSWRPTG